jgi:hypothetical protein
MPRHPPCALNNLATKMLASTVQFSKYGQTRHHHHRKPTTTTPTSSLAASRPVGQRPPQPLTKGHPPTVGAYSLRTQQCAAPPTKRSAGKMSAFHPQNNHPRRTPRPWLQIMLLRKEVIQPHLPVRLPCYDFVPIASPTFDGSPPKGLGHRLRVLPTFVT